MRIVLPHGATSPTSSDSNIRAVDYEGDDTSEDETIPLPDRIAKSNRALKRHHSAQQLIPPGRDGMRRPYLSIEARRTMWSVVREWTEMKGPTVLSATNAIESPTAVTMYLVKGKKAIKVNGLRELGHSWLQHVYGTRRRNVIAMIPDKTYGPFRIRQDVEVVDAINDPRGVTKLVRATRSISKFQFIGMYEGRNFYEYERPAVSCLRRLENDYKLSEVIGAPGMLIDGQYCVGAYGWTSELNDYRDNIFETTDASKTVGKKEPNCQIVEVLIAKFPALFMMALREITQGEEVTLDYGEKFWPIIIPLLRDDKIISELLQPLNDALPKLLPALEALLDFHCQTMLYLAELQSQIVDIFEPTFAYIPQEEQGIVQGLIDTIAVTHGVFSELALSMHHIIVRTKHDEDEQAKLEFSWGCRKRGGSQNPARIFAMYLDEIGRAAQGSELQDSIHMWLSAVVNVCTQAANLQEGWHNLADKTDAQDQIGGMNLVSPTSIMISLNNQVRIDLNANQDDGDSVALSDEPEDNWHDLDLGPESPFSEVFSESEGEDMEISEGNDEEEVEEEKLLEEGDVVSSVQGIGDGASQEVDEILAEGDVLPKPKLPTFKKRAMAPSLSSENSKGPKDKLPTSAKSPKISPKGKKLSVTIKEKSPRSKENKQPVNHSSRFRPSSTYRRRTVVPVQSSPIPPKKTSQPVSQTPASNLDHKNIQRNRGSIFQQSRRLNQDSRRRGPLAQRAPSTDRHCLTHGWCNHTTGNCFQRLKSLLSSQRVTERLRVDSFRPGRDYYDILHSQYYSDSSDSSRSPSPVRTKQPEPTPSINGVYESSYLDAPTYSYDVTKDNEKVAELTRRQSDGAFLGTSLVQLSGIQGFPAINKKLKQDWKAKLVFKEGDIYWVKYDAVPNYAVALGIAKHIQPLWQHSPSQSGLPLNEYTENVDDIYAVVKSEAITSVFGTEEKSARLIEDISVADNDLHPFFQKLEVVVGLDSQINYDLDAYLQYFEIDQDVHALLSRVKELFVEFPSLVEAFQGYLKDIHSVDSENVEPSSSTSETIEPNQLAVLRTNENQSVEASLLPPRFYPEDDFAEACTAMPEHETEELVIHGHSAITASPIKLKDNIGVERSNALAAAPSRGLSNTADCSMGGSHNLSNSLTLRENSNHGESHHSSVVYDKNSCQNDHNQKNFDDDVYGSVHAPDDALDGFLGNETQIFKAHRSSPFVRANLPTHLDTGNSGYVLDAPLDESVCWGEDGRMRRGAAPMSSGHSSSQPDMEELREVSNNVWNEYIVQGSDSRTGREPAPVTRAHLHFRKGSHGFGFLPNDCHLKDDLEYTLSPGRKVAGSGRVSSRVNADDGSDDDLALASHRHISRPKGTGFGQKEITPTEILGSVLDDHELKMVSFKPRKKRVFRNPDEDDDEAQCTSTIHEDKDN
ncbi:hypothetical protein BC830DRAFT_1098611 [Chytriomyces sp. MP71]|nr:hypothetical protein BC830DRAFT_1098611 [Chytriomyces sp. MP71]